MSFISDDEMRDHAVAVAESEKQARLAIFQGYLGDQEVLAQRKNAIAMVSEAQATAIVLAEATKQVEASRVAAIARGDAHRLYTSTTSDAESP